jgi:virginiamycin B lyase
LNKYGPRLFNSVGTERAPIKRTTDGNGNRPGTHPGIPAIATEQFTNAASISNTSNGDVTFTTYTSSSMDCPGATALGSDGAIWFTNLLGNTIGRISSTGTVTDYSNTYVDNPDAITAGPDSALWFTNENGGYIRRITTKGVLTQYTSPTVHTPDAISTGPDGALWFTNSGNNSIGRITTAPTISGTPTSPVDGGQPYTYSFDVVGFPPPTVSITSGACRRG